MIAAARVPARFLATVGGYAGFTWDCAAATLRHGLRAETTLREAYAIGVRSLPVLITMAVFVGTNLSIQGHAAFRTLGAHSLVGMFVALAGVREVCPLLAGTMVAAKTGTEICAQLAVMRTKEQIDALEVMAVNPYSELIAPRLLAIVLVMPALTVLTLAAAIASATAVAVWQLDVNPGEFRDYVFDNIRLADLGIAVLKGVLFGAVIATVSGFFGLTSERGPEGVGRATNRAIVAICVVCVMLNYLVTAVAYR